LDRDKTRAFLDDVVEMIAGATAIGMLAVGDRSGLLAAMTNDFSGTPAEIAAAAHLDPRYTKELVEGLYSAGILTYDPSSGRFALPPEHAAVIADDASPYSMAGWLDMVPAALEHTDSIADATRSGGGVPFDAFGETMIRGIDRGNRPSMNILLTRRWLTKMPDIVERLSDGGRIADFGCGSGAAVSAMARAFPNTSVTGFDISEKSIARARATADSDQTEFVVGSASKLADQGPWDLVTIIDVAHDLGDPVSVLADIRRGLAPDGVVFVMEPRIPDAIEDRTSPATTMLYGISLFHCMTQSLAGGGAGLGATVGTTGLQDVFNEAGYSNFKQLDIDNPFSAFYRAS